MNRIRQSGSRQAGETLEVIAVGVPWRRAGRIVRRSGGGIRRCFAHGCRGRGDACRNCRGAFGVQLRVVAPGYRQACTRTEPLFPLAREFDLLYVVRLASREVRGASL